MQRVDCVIAGGGLTGLALAAALGKTGADVAVVEAKLQSRLAHATHDGRVTAIARGSKIFLDTIDVWPALEDSASPIWTIAVGESGSSFGVQFDSAAVGGEPVGYIVENRLIRQALDQVLETLDNVRVLAPATLRSLEVASGAVRISGDGFEELDASLVAVCEGRQSPTREVLGIASKHWRYRQTAFVGTFAHSEPHHGRAVERFFADGPFAMLPMRGNFSSIVWALDDDLAKTVAGLDDDDFTTEVQSRFGDELGELTLASPRWSYPLSLVWADSYVADRAILVGDAAHGIHPIAGQGWNLALRDVAAAAELTVDRLRLGLDPGSPDALADYAAWRSFDGLALVAVTDGINRLFANDITPLRMIRNLGLGMVDRLPPAKHFFMHHAMGLIGNLPRTMRGEAL